MSNEKKKKAIYKRWWFILLMIIIGLGIIGSIGSGDDEKKNAQNKVSENKEG